MQKWYIYLSWQPFVHGMQVCQRINWYMFYDNTGCAEAWSTTPDGKVLDVDDDKMHARALFETKNDLIFVSIILI